MKTENTSNGLTQDQFYSRASRCVISGQDDDGNPEMKRLCFISLDELNDQNSAFVQTQHCTVAIHKRFQ